MRDQRIIVNQELREQQVNARPELSVLHGIDGVSPIATVTQTATGATISITDRDGTTTANILNGEQGPKGDRGERGFSPIASVTKSGNTATITITDKNGTTTASVSDGTTPTLATVATTGDYDDLIDKPTIPTAGTITSGSTGYATGGDVYTAIGNVETILSTLNNGGGAQ